AFIFTGRGVGHRRQRGIDVGQRARDQNRIGLIVAVATADGRGQPAADRERAMPNIERGGEAVGVVGAAVGGRYRKTGQQRSNVLRGGDRIRRRYHRRVGGTVHRDGGGGLGRSRAGRGADILS